VSAGGTGHTLMGTVLTIFRAYGKFEVSGQADPKNLNVLSDQHFPVMTGFTRHFICDTSLNIFLK